jgi:hypothetical protein
MVKIISSFYKKYSSASFLPLIDILIKQFNCKKKKKRKNYAKKNNIIIFIYLKKKIIFFFFFSDVHPEDGELLDEKIDFCQYFTSLLESMTG